MQAQRQGGSFALAPRAVTRAPWISCKYTSGFLPLCRTNQFLENIHLSESLASCKTPTQWDSTRLFVVCRWKNSMGLNCFVCLSVFLGGSGSHKRKIRRTYESVVPKGQALCWVLEMKGLIAFVLPKRTTARGGQACLSCWERTN